MKYYKELTASFENRDNLYTVEPNNLKELQAAFELADNENTYIEMMLMEPVMGEGCPGVAISREFYQLARQLTNNNDTLLLIDSIQACLRAHGCLSIASYPGFEELAPPDMESFSKALNGGQYPVSVLAMSESAAALFKKGVYGNTMTANPRGLEAACHVLDEMTPQRRQNIVDKGKELNQKFLQLGNEFPDAITEITGTGLLVAIHLNQAGYSVVGQSGLERYLRTQGIGVIHGGENALRFTPYFDITTADVDLIVECVRNALKRGPVYN
jgi:acetylornithine/succinyldiaminopimelate/putrescine aminotransferase